MEKLKQQWIRGQQIVKRKLGKTQTTVDEDYSQTHARFEQHEKISANAKKHVGQLIENFHAMSTTFHFLAEDMRDVYFNTEGEDIAKKLSATAEEIEHKCVKVFQDKTQSQVVDPISQYHAQFNPLKELHSQRKNRLLEWEYHRDRVSKLAEKPNAKNPLELPKAKEQLQKAKEELEEVDNNAKHTFGEVVDRRTDIYDPAIHSLIDSLASYFSQMAEITKNLQQSTSNIRCAAREEARFYPEATATSSSGSSSAVTPPGQVVTPAKAVAVSAVPAELDTEWFYLDAKVQQQGPVTALQLRDKFKGGELTAESHVFRGEMENWTPLNQLPKLMQFVSK